MIRKEIHKIKLENQEYLKSIRNSIVAHKDHNTRTQIVTLETLNIDKIYLACIKIFSLFITIHSFEVKLINVANESNKQRQLAKKKSAKNGLSKKLADDT